MQMTDKEKNEEVSEEAQYKEAVRAMNNGDNKAKTKVAYYKLTGRGDGEVDAREAVALLEERVKDGDDEAKWMLGLCCEYGIGIKQDIARALLLYQQSNGAKNVVGEFLVKNDRCKRGSAVMNGRWSW